MKNNKELSPDTHNQKTRKLRRIGAVAALAVGAVGGIVSQHDSAEKEQVAETSAEVTAAIMPSAEKLAVGLANDKSGLVSKAAMASNEDGQGMVSSSDITVDTASNVANNSISRPVDNEFTYLVYNNKENARLVIKVTGRQVLGDPAIVEEGSIRYLSFEEQDLTKPVAATADSPASYGETSRIVLDPLEGKLKVDFNNGQNHLDSTDDPRPAFNEAVKLIDGYLGLVEGSLRERPNSVPTSVERVLAE